MKIKLAELLEIDRLQRLMDKFTGFTNMGTAILDMEGKTLVASGWQDICTKFHRVHPKTCSNCLKSDTSLANNLKEGKSYNVYKCLNGMIDIAVPIIINDIHVGNLFTGQFLFKKPDQEFFRKQAIKYKFNVDEYLKALSKVLIIPEDEIKKKMDFLLELSELIVTMSINKMELVAQTNNQEAIIEQRTKNLKEVQLATLNMMQDVEESKKQTESLNKELEISMQNLKRSNEELEQFAYVASHDLQEPLRMVASYTQLLERRYKDKLDDDAKEFIGFAVDGATRMQRLINDLLDYSRVTTRGKEFSKIDLSNVLGMAVSNLHNKIQENHAIVTNDELPFCWGDELQLTRVFQNLIDNAIKFKSELIPHIHISFKDEDNKITVFIKDNGLGIDPQYHDRVFTIFQRLHGKKEYPGTGIGLAICKRTIERHGGTISIDSILGEGTTFIFTLKKGRK